METIGRGRRNGKTTKMINWWLEDPDNRIVVCAKALTRIHTLNLLRGLYSLDEGTWLLAKHHFIVGLNRIRGFGSLIGADDFDMLPRWDRQELVDNPRFAVYTVNN